MQLTYTYKIEQREVSAKANPLNTNDLGRFIRQELCRLFGGMGWLGFGNFGQCWPRFGGVRLELLSMLIEVGGVGLEPRRSQ